MPAVSVPRIQPSANATGDTIQVAYSVSGSGPRLVALIPGLCTPSVMYRSMVEHIARVAPGEYTTVSIDNRGSGESDAPPPAASMLDALRGRLAYSTNTLAYDAWDVLDAVRETKRHEMGGTEPYLPEVGLVGHSMGGMVTQRMVVQRPHAVGFCAMMNSHSGGLQNYLPMLFSPTIHLGLLRVALNRFDAGAVALFNLDLHFSSSFLDQLITHDKYAVRRSMRNPVKAIAKEGRRRLNDALQAGRSRIVKRRRRRDFYFARYMGKDFDWTSGGASHSRNVPMDTSSPTQDTSVVVHGSSTNSTAVDGSQADAADTTDTAESGTDPPPFLPHALTAAFHRLSSTEQGKFRRCRRLQTLVLAGMSDLVISPASSRRLAHSLESSAFVEVPGAHFVFDEREEYVNALIELGLRNSFNRGGAQRSGASDECDEAFDESVETECRCEWCNGGHESDQSTEPGLGAAKERQVPESSTSNDQASLSSIGAYCNEAINSILRRRKRF